MRAYSWMAFAGVVLSCGGGAFSGNDTGGEGGSGADDDGGKGGVLGKAGLGSGGKLGGGGKVGSGGVVGTGGGIIGVGGFGIAGDLVAGGSFPVAGEPGVAGTGPDPDPIDEACPADLPDVSRGCAEGLTCSYGDDVRSSCRTRVKCQQGVWTVYDVDCPVLHGCPNIVQGSECDANALPCTIEGYIYCVCTGCSVGGACSSETVWKCSAGSGSAACPDVIPNEGQPCAGGLVCPYGSCITDGPVTASCNGATWGWESMQCPQ